MKGWIGVMVKKYTGLNMVTEVTEIKYLTE